MKKLRITVGKNTYDVTVEVLEDDQAHVARPGGSAVLPAAPQTSSPAPGPAPGPAAPSGPAPAGAVVSPMAGTVKSIAVKQGDSVTAGQLLVVLDAMKMENQVSAPAAGTVKSIDVSAGESVQEGQPLLVIG